MSEQKQKVKITVSQIKNDLGQGLDRKAIRAKYGISATDVKAIFQHPSLKGARVKAAPGFELEDDTATEGEANVATGEAVASNNAPAPKKAAAKSKAKIQTDAASKPTGQAADVVQESQEEVEKESEPNDNPGSGISEVQTPEDDDDEVESQKGVW